MGKILFIFLILCTVVGGTIWLKMYQPKTRFFESAESFVTGLMGEVGDTLFLKQPPPPDPEAVTRFKEAVDRELERLNTTQQLTGKSAGDSQHASGARVPETHTSDTDKPAPVFERLEGAAALSQ